MSIDKNSSGLPSVDLARRTTKVNFAMILGVVLFLVGAGAMVYYLASRPSDPPTSSANSPGR